MLRSLIWPGFVVLLLAQWLVPTQMIWKKNKVLTQGTSYKFETEPVDPSDPFLGKYIILNFRENAFKTADNGSFTYGSKVYVHFRNENNGFARIESIHLKKPPGTNYLETTVNYIRDEKAGTTVFLNYPFTRYYMQEYKAPQAENIYRESRIDSTIKTYALVNIYNGDAIVKDVYINDSLINDVIQARNRVR